MHPVGLETLVKNHFTILSSFYPSLAAILSEFREYALRRVLDLYLGAQVLVLKA